jgi:hypothetical protein
MRIELRFGCWKSIVGTQIKEYEPDTPLKNLYKLTHIRFVFRQRLQTQLLKRVTTII